MLGIKKRESEDAGCAKSQITQTDLIILLKLN